MIIVNRVQSADSATRLERNRNSIESLVSPPGAHPNPTISNPPAGSKDPGISFAPRKLSLLQVNWSCCCSNKVLHTIFFIRNIREKTHRYLLFQRTLKKSVVFKPIKSIFVVSVTLGSSLLLSIYIHLAVNIRGLL